MSLPRTQVEKGGLGETWMLMWDICKRILRLISLSLSLSRARALSLSLSLSLARSLLFDLALIRSRSRSFILYNVLSRSPAKGRRRKQTKGSCKVRRLVVSDSAFLTDPDLRGSWSACLIRCADGRAFSTTEPRSLYFGKNDDVIVGVQLMVKPSSNDKTSHLALGKKQTCGRCDSITFCVYTVSNCLSAMCIPLDIFLLTIMSPPLKRTPSTFD